MLIFYNVKSNSRRQMDTSWILALVHPLKYIIHQAIVSEMKQNIKRQVISY